MKFFVYAISSEQRPYIYVGLTNNLTRRIQQHNNGQERTTKPYRPFKVIFTEELIDRTKARARERYLKSGIGKEFLKNL